MAKRVWVMVSQALLRSAHRLSWALCALMLVGCYGSAGRTPLPSARPAPSRAPVSTSTPAASPAPAGSPAVIASQQLAVSAVRFEHLTINEGLAQSSITCIFQESLGFLWFGTDEGLDRYDGSAFKVYRNDPDVPDSLSDNRIRSIAEDSRGFLWIGTLNGGLDRFDRGTESFTHYRHDAKTPDSLTDNQVVSLAAGANGEVWVGTARGLDLFNASTGLFKHITHDPGQPANLAEDRITALYLDSTGGLWVGTPNGLDRLDLKSGQYSHYQNNPGNPRSLANNHINALLEGRNGWLWVGTQGGLDRFDPKSGFFAHFQHDPDDPNSLSGNDISGLAEDPTGAIWVSSYSGTVSKLDPASGWLTNFANDSQDPYSVSRDEIDGLYTDRQGNLWIATARSGINKVPYSTKRFFHYRHDSRNPNSLVDGKVFSIYQEAQGTLWVGTVAGLDRLEQATGNFILYASDPRIPTSLSDNFISSIQGGQAGELWIGTLRGGLNRMDPTSGTFTRFQHDENNPRSLSDDSVLSVYEDSRHILWVGTAEGGLNRYDPQSGGFIHYLHDGRNANSLLNNRVWSIYEDRTGLLWLGTGGGLDRLDPQTSEFRAYPDEADNPPALQSTDVFAVMEDSTGTIWAATYGNGLSKLDRVTGSITHYRIKNGLPSDTVYGILEDDQGKLWLSTNKGLSRFDPHTGAFKNYDVKDGLQSDEFNSASYFKSKSGEMFFGGVNGVTAFYPQEIQDNANTPVVALTSLTQHGEPLKGLKAPELAKEISLAWPDNYFDFDFTTLDYTRPEKNQYAYMLENFDKDWNTIGTRHSGRYTNLPGGRYILHLKGSNNDGVWNEAGTTIRITVVPPVWQTWWFQAGAILVVIAAISAAIRIRVSSMEGRNRELEKLVRLRTAKIEEHNQEMEALYRADERMHRYLNLEQVLQTLVDVAVVLLHAEKSAVLTWDAKLARLNVKVDREFTPGSLALRAFCDGENPAKRAAETKSTLVFQDIDTDLAGQGQGQEAQQAMRREGIRSMMLMPVRTGGEVFAVFGVFSTSPGVFTAEAQRLFATLVQRASLSIENAQLFEQTRELAVVEERSRLARDLHDSAKQKAFAALAQLGTANGVVNNDPSAAKEHLCEAENLVYEVIEELTFLIQEMYPKALQEKGLANALREYVFEWENRADAQVDLQIENERRLDLEMEQALYRVVQEALSNVARHSRANHVTVKVAFADGEVQVYVADNGVGFERSITQEGVGMRSMQERVAKIHGTLRIESTPGQGTRVIAGAPCPER